MPATSAPPTGSQSHALPAAAELAAQLRERLPAWRQVHWTARTGSTQSDLLQSVMVNPPARLPALLGAHEQTEGRGRAGRPYFNQPGQALMMSCAFLVQLPVAALPTLATWLAVASAELIREQVSPPADLTLKWPNDINWRGAKLAGMLLESAREANAAIVVVGMGLNLCGSAELAAALERPIADWQQTGSATPPLDLAAGLASAWQAAIAVAERHWQPGVGLEALPTRFADCDGLANASVVLRDHNTIIDEGRALGVRPDGRLRLQTAQGERAISVGELSLRPSS